MPIGAGVACVQFEAFATPGCSACCKATQIQQEMQDMGTRTIRAMAVGMVLSAVGATALAQDAVGPRPIAVTFTAGQGGLMQASVQTTQTFYSFTGDVDARVRAERSWQRVAGPRFRVGQAEITLPSGR
jgi:hypothetical protein